MHITYVVGNTRLFTRSVKPRINLTVSNRKHVASVYRGYMFEDWYECTTLTGGVKCEMTS